MARFYSFSHKDMMDMDLDTFHSYWLMIDRLEPQEMLVDMSVGDYANMKKEDRKKYHKDIHKKAYPLESSKVKLLTTEEAFKALGKMLNG